jgi:[ribosomal protein S5]-alanine N-acetyltransferase
MEFGPRPQFSTPRLRITPVFEADAPTMLTLLGEPELFRYLEQEPPTLAYLTRQYRLLESGVSPNGTEAWLTWICTLESSHQAIGYVQATVRPTSCSIAYVFGSDYQRRGYAREAVLAMLGILFQHYGVSQVQAEIDTRNAASIALAKSLHFRHVRTVVVVQTSGATIDEHEYALSRDDFGH